MRHFAEELEELKQALLEMGALVESSIHTSVQALTEHDDRLARRVIEDEALINKMELDLDARVTRLLALNQPVAGDLRLLVMCLKINTDLERMGDLAVSVAELAGGNPEAAIELAKSLRTRVQELTERLGVLGAHLEADVVHGGRDLLAGELSGSDRIMSANARGDVAIGDALHLQRMQFAEIGDLIEGQRGVLDESHSIACCDWTRRRPDARAPLAYSCCN